MALPSVRPDSLRRSERLWSRSHVSRSLFQGGGRATGRIRRTDQCLYGVLPRSLLQLRLSVALRGLPARSYSTADPAAAELRAPLHRPQILALTPPSRSTRPMPASAYEQRQLPSMS